MSLNAHARLTELLFTVAWVLALLGTVFELILDTSQGLVFLEVRFVLIGALMFLVSILIFSLIARTSRMGGILQRRGPLLVPIIFIGLSLILFAISALAYSATSSREVYQASVYFRQANLWLFFYFVALFYTFFLEYARSGLKRKLRGEPCEQPESLTVGSLWVLGP